MKLKGGEKKKAEFLLKYRPNKGYAVGDDVFLLMFSCQKIRYTACLCVVVNKT